MKEINKRDGFCRAPRIEMILENDKNSNMSFDEMLDKAKYTVETMNDNGVIKILNLNALAHKDG